MITKGICLNSPKQNNSAIKHKTNEKTCSCVCEIYVNYITFQFWFITLHLTFVDNKSRAQYMKCWQVAKRIEHHSIEVNIYVIEFTSKYVNLSWFLMIFDLCRQKVWSRSKYCIKRVIGGIGGLEKCWRVKSYQF